MKKDLKQFVLDTLLPYKEDPSTCGVQKNGEGANICCYLTDDGKKCALGKHLKEGRWQEARWDAEHLFEQYDPKDILTDEALSYDIPIEAWTEIQNYHDSLSMLYYSLANNSLYEIESVLEIELPELLLEY